MGQTGKCIPWVKARKRLCMENYQLVFDRLLKGYFIFRKCSIDLCFYHSGWTALITPTHRLISSMCLCVSSVQIGTPVSGTLTHTYTQGRRTRCVSSTKFKDAAAQKNTIAERALTHANLDSICECRIWGFYTHTKTNRQSPDLTFASVLWDFSTLVPNSK